MPAKKTHADFVSQFNQVLEGKGYQIIGEYMGNHTKLAIECPVHGVWKARPKALLKGHGCRQCANKKMSAHLMKTHPEFVAQFNQVHKDKGYTVIGNYVGNKTKIAIQCPTHGIWKAAPAHVLKGQGCPKCAGTQKKTHTEFVTEFNQVHKNKGYTVIGDYVNNKTKIAIQCPFHGIWESTPANSLKGQGCPECGMKLSADKNRKTHAEFVTEFNQVHGGKGYQVVSEYVNIDTNIAIECPTHGVWKATANSLLQGRGCRRCGIKQRSETQKKTHAEFLAQFNQAHGSKGYTVVGKYIGAHKKIAIECPIHGIWEATADSLLNGTGCPCCSKTGFHCNQAAIFYLYEIIKDKNIYYGFGISNVYEEREKKHLKNLSDGGANVTHQWLYQFESGYECKGLEDDLKATLKEIGLNHNLGIDGFHTECAKEEAARLIMQHVNKANCHPIDATS